MEAYNNEHPHKNKVHKVLAHSYAAYLVLFLVGMSLDLIFQLKIFTTSTIIFVGPVLLLFGTFLIFWAQKTSRALKEGDISKEAFCRGPYCYTKSPTHWGLFFLMLGFGITANAFFIVLSTLLSFFINQFVFLTKRERIMEEKYGAHYTEYKKLVKF